MTDQPAPAVGQIWRYTRTGALRRITEAINTSNSFAAPYYDVRWETVKKPRRTGASFEDYWLRDCEFVARNDRALEGTSS